MYVFNFTCAYHQSIVLSVTICYGVVIIEVVGLEAWQTIEVVLQPLPYITIHIIEPQ